MTKFQKLQEEYKKLGWKLTYHREGGFHYSFCPDDGEERWHNPMYHCSLKAWITSYNVQNAKQAYNVAQMVQDLNWCFFRIGV